MAQDTPDVLEREYLRSPSAREPYHLEKEDAAIIFESKVFADATERLARESRAEHVVFRDLIVSDVIDIAPGRHPMVRSVDGVGRFVYVAREDAFPPLLFERLVERSDSAKEIDVREWRHSFLYHMVF